MIPLRDENPTRSFPIVTILLIAANALVFFIQQSDRSGLFNAGFCMVPAEITTGHDFIGVLHITQAGQTFMKLPSGVFPQNLGPYDIYLGVSPRPIWVTIFTAMFMHAGWLHIGGNMLYLWIFGNNVEDALGKLKFLIFYLVCGVAAAFAQTAVDPTSLIPTLGASGAIAGVLGAYVILFPDARVLTLIGVGIFFLREVRAVWVIGIWIVLQFIPAVTSLGSASTGGVAYFAHVGGFLAGLLIVLLLGGRGLVQNPPRRSN